MLLLKSSINHSWAWSADTDNAERIFAQTYPSVYKHMKPFEARLRRRKNQGLNWWELHSCTYFDLFGQQKIIYSNPIRLVNTGPT
jgi:hypothetical protein